MRKKTNQIATEATESATTWQSTTLTTAFMFKVAELLPTLPLHQVELTSTLPLSITRPPNNPT